MDRVFSCKCCGYCCHGETTVSLTVEDQKNMLEVLKISRSEAQEKYWKKSAAETQMKTIDGHCIFYDNGCSIHSGRPWRCRQWPLVPAILHDKSNLTAIQSSCPGIDSSASYEEVCDVIKQSSYTKY